MDLKNQIELELYFAEHFDTILFPVLADIYLTKEDFKRARKVCSIGLKHHKNNTPGLFILAKLDQAEGNLKEAEKTLENILLYSKDHLAAAVMLCELQTVLGRASNRLLKSWKHVLSLSPNHQTALDFIKKVEVTDDKITKKIITPKKSPEVTIAPKINSGVKTALPVEAVLEKPQEPLKVSSRLATFTLVSVLKNQGLFDQALEVLDALETKGENLESISLERDIIKTIIKNSQKD